MKFILTLLLFVPAIAFCQKDTKIIVKVSDTSNIIKRVVDAFNERGYTIDQQSDKFVSTKEKDLAKATAPTEIKLRAFFKDSTLTFSGEFKVNITFMGQPPSFMQMERRGVKNSVYMVSWNEMDGIAKEFGSVSYVH